MIRWFRIGIYITVFFMITTGMVLSQDKAAERSDLEDEEINELKIDPGKAAGTKSDKPAEKSESAPAKDSKDSKAEDSGKTGEVSKCDQKAEIYTSGSNTYVNAKTKFELMATAPVTVDKIFYRINNGGDLLYNSPFGLQKEGEYIINHYGIDKLGNKETAKTFKVIVDSTPPEVKVSSSMGYIKGKLYICKDLVFTVTAKDNLSGVRAVEYTTDGTDYFKYEKPFTVQSDKDVSLIIRTTDNVGNCTLKFLGKAMGKDGKEENLKDNPVKLSVDNKPPTVQIKTDKEPLKQEAKLIVSTDYRFMVTAADEDSGVASIMVKIDGKGDFQPYKEPIKFTTGGEHSIEAVAYDVVGNKSEPVFINVIVNTTPPTSNYKIQSEE